MNKDLFYQVGFYSLMAFIIGFIVGTLCPFQGKCHVIDNKVIIHDTCYIDTDSINKKSKVSYSIPRHPNDSAVLLELKRQNIKHPDIVLAQAKLETAHYTSDVCKKNNNLFGLMKGDKYHHFPHWKHSIKFYKEHVQSRYDGGNYYAFLNKIGYAEDKSYTQKLKKLV